MSDELNVCRSERPADLETWLAAKKNWIGASEVGSLFTDEHGDHLGFDSPLELLRKKAGMVADVSRPELEIYGDLEVGLLFRWEKKRPGSEMAWLNRSRDVYYHPDHPALRATPDAIIGDCKRLVQLKVTADRRADWDEHPPFGYLLQVQAEMYCTGAKEADLYALFRCERPYMVDEVWTMQADPELQAQIAERATAFKSLVDEWRAGDHRRTPELHSEDGAALARLVAGRAGDVVLQADERLAAMVAEWHGAKEYAAGYSSAQEGAKKLEKMLRHRIVGAMGEASLLVLPDGRRLRAKSVEREAYDVGESAWVDLSFVKPPKEKKK